MLQVFFVVGESLVPRSLINHISGKTHVPETHILALKMVLEHRLDPGGMLHSVGQTIAVNGDDIVLLEFKQLVG